ncbi:hypothetical protein VE23_10640 [Paenibacillus sp. D9]|nr:hypothetical protein VE23_10640 [Paenibacillus sp. D9]
MGPPCPFRFLRPVRHLGGSGPLLREAAGQASCFVKKSTYSCVVCKQIVFIINLELLSFNRKTAKDQGFQGSYGDRLSALGGRGNEVKRPWTAVPFRLMPVLIARAPDARLFPLQLA